MGKKMASRIASLEDAPADAALIRQVITGAGHDCVTFAESRRLLLALRDAGFDLLLLDWQMPDLSGREVLAWVRTHLDRRIPVMFLTCREAELDIVNALAAGADDYMVKPVRPAELAARIDCLLRRAYPAQLAPLAPLRLGEYAFDCALRKVTCNGHPVGLTPKEFDLAVLPFRNEGRIVTRDHITAAVWGREISPLSRTIDTHVSRVRSKLGLQAGHGLRLTPVYTHGYRLERTDRPERTERAAA
ncbi:transcriptional regulator [Cupriavidus sp. SK-4]|uniref:response regulator transcription factor n=1 Tax=Cupriavidus sp. SK-4 TaxID=574750 RepID=UPI00044AC849|nr:response regulator transcription factor [Cupriavidus sp. SK-4]EYS85076.1 transcriptional regulator [Cupriavidus sp. SK-4]